MNIEQLIYKLLKYGLKRRVAIAIDLDTDKGYIIIGDGFLDVDSVIVNTEALERPRVVPQHEAVRRDERGH